MATTPQSPPEGSKLRHRLAGLRRRLRLVTTFRGASWFLTLVLTTAVLTGLLDWRLHLPGLVRAFALVGLLAGAGVIAYRHLVRPLGARSDDLALALRVEESYPSLNDSLASTVQFLDAGPGAGGASPSLQREAVRRALRKVEGCDFNRVVDTRGLRTAGVSALASCAAALALAFLFPGLAATALVRLADPFGTRDWPRQTRLELDEPATRVGRGQAYQVGGRLFGVVPPEAVVELSFDSFPPAHKTLRVSRADDGSGRFKLHLRPEEVQRPFRFRVQANDAISPEFAVDVLPPPTLVKLGGKPSPQVRLHYPAYTDLRSPEDLAPGMGDIQAVTGTEVTFRAAADRPLRRAWIEYLPEAREAPASLSLAPLGARDGVGAVSTLALAASASAPVPARLDGEGHLITVRFRPHLRGRYAIHLEDETGLHNSREYALRLDPDPAPTVRLVRPSAAKDVLRVLPTAELPLEVVAEDPRYAVRSVFLEYRLAGEEGSRTITLYDHRVGLARDLAPLAGPAVLGAPVPRLRPGRLEFVRTLPLKALKRPDGSDLEEGDVVTLRACADDFDDVTVAKQPGRSDPVEIYIVGRRGLELELNKEQAAVQQELVRMREMQREALAKVAEAEARLKKGEPLVPEREAREVERRAQEKSREAGRLEERAAKASGEEKQRLLAEARELRAEADKLHDRARELDRQATQLTEAEQLQQQLRARVGDDREGLRAQVDRVLRALKQNGMEHSASRQNMEAVARELGRLARNELEQIGPGLTNARKLAELLDERARAERRAELEQKAKDAEREARAAERAAGKSDEDAARAERRAAETPDAKARKRYEEEAARLRKRAEELRGQAREQRGQADRHRRDAEQTAEPEQAREALAQARKQQEEVDKTLASLLQPLEAYSSTREIKSDAVRLLQEQKALQERLDELAKKDLTGKSVEDLAKEEKARLEDLRDSQRRLRERADQLVNKMKAVAEDRKERDPETAEDLRGAASRAEAGDLSGKMKEAAEKIRTNELNAARKRQEEAVAELEKVVKDLEGRREAELDRLVQKLRKAEEELARLEQEQDQLRKKVEEAGKIADPKRREDELKRLARRQQELQKKTEDALRRLSRAQSERARQALGRAFEEMEEAARELSRGERDQERQDEALERIQEARRELARARRQAEEELGREQLGRVADLLRRLKDRQQALGAEVDRIQNEVRRGGAWARPLLASLRNLGEGQKGLSAETAEVATKELAPTPVFARLVKKAAESMGRAGDRLGTMVVGKRPEPKALPDEELATHQAEALRRLEQLLEAIKDAQQGPRPLAEGAGGRRQGDGEGADGDAGRGADEDGLPPLAQLRLLRLMQKDLNDRTDAFKKKHPDPAKLGAREKAELGGLQKEQKEIADLLEELLRPAEDRGEPEDDK
jgi:hypothetical protein